MEGSTKFRIDEDRLEELFSVLAHETRLKILFALWQRPRSSHDEKDTLQAGEDKARWASGTFDEPISFSELRDAVGVKDAGQFNYHLKKLLGTFIERTDEGYTHLASGRAVYQAMVASVSMNDADVGPIPLDSACHACDGRLLATYERQVFTVGCDACGEVRMALPFLPAGVDGRDDDERVEAFERWSRRVVSLTSDGVCPWCSGRMSTRPRSAVEGDSFGIRHTCERCEARLATSIGESVVDHPAVVSFYYDHGLDVTAIPLWELPFTAGSEHVVVSEDPWRGEVRIELDGDVLALVIDEELNVVNVRRTVSNAPE